MSAYVSRRALSRRGFLRGAGACLGLPWLDAMQPALTRERVPAPRALFVFAPNGKHMVDWRPHGEGFEASLPFLLEPLRPLFADLTVISNLAIDGGNAHGDGPGDHARAAGSFLTCAHPKKTGGADLRTGVSVDQVLAAAIGGTSLLPSLELGMEPGAAAGVCDSGYSCAYSNNVAWRTPSTPAAKETDPRATFVRLFGDPAARGDAATAARARRRTRSILDAAQADAKELAGRLGPADRGKLGEYLDAVRGVEQRIEHLEAESREAESREATRDGVDPRFLDEGLREGFPGKLRVVYELIALAMQTERTRVFSLMLGNAGSDRSYRFLGVPDGHHFLSHHGNDPQKLAAIRTINRFHTEEFARFLSRLKATKEGSGDLLGNAAIVYGSGISDGNRHNHDDLPFLLAGRAAGALRPRGHLRCRPDTPAANLYLTLLRAFGLDQDAFADSTGVLAGLA